MTSVPCRCVRCGRFVQLRVGDNAGHWSLRDDDRIVWRTLDVRTSRSRHASIGLHESTGLSLVTARPVTQPVALIWMPLAPSSRYLCERPSPYRRIWLHNVVAGLRCRCGMIVPDTGLSRPVWCGDVTACRNPSLPYRPSHHGERIGKE